MSCCFAIVPDAQERPVAVFADLEDAITWACERFCDGRYKISFLELMQVERDEPSGRRDGAS
jgi:hypothetical protein